LMPLGPGDLLSVPTWSRTELHNEGHETAKLLVLSVGLETMATPRMDPAYPQGQSTTYTGQTLPSWWAGVQESIDGERMITSLTRFVNTPLPPEGGTLAIARATLSAGSQFAIREARAPHMLVVNGGSVEITGLGPVQKTRDRGTDRILDQLDAGESTLLPTGAVASLTNSDAEPVVITIVAILPAEA
jgi:hypothetical protein